MSNFPLDTILEELAYAQNPILDLSSYGSSSAMSHDAFRAIIDALATSSVITHLKLCGRRLNTEEAEYLSAKLPLTRVVHLDLSENGLGPKGAALVAAIPNLVTLNLSRND